MSWKGHFLPAQKNLLRKKWQFSHYTLWSCCLRCKLWIQDFPSTILCKTTQRMVGAQGDSRGRKFPGILWNITVYSSLCEQSLWTELPQRNALKWQTSEYLFILTHAYCHHLTSTRSWALSVSETSLGQIQGPPDENEWCLCSTTSAQGLALKPDFQKISGKISSVHYAYPGLRYHKCSTTWLGDNWHPGSDCPWRST